MLLQALRLKNFRLYQDYVLHFEQPLCLLLGPNASGKSSLIEAIRLLSTGHSFRANKIEQMIGFGQELARVKGNVVVESKLKAASSQRVGNSKQSEDLQKKFQDDLQKYFQKATQGAPGTRGERSRQGDRSTQGDRSDFEKLQLSLLLTRGQLQGRSTRKLLYTVNGNRRRASDFRGKLLTVVFRPEDLRLVEGSPARRRDYLNDPISLVGDNYNHSLDKYHQALRQRNSLLKRIQKGEEQASALKYWDLTLVKHGKILQHLRQRYVKFVNTQVEPPLDFELKYQPSLISQEELDSHRSGAIGAGYTLVGPQRDDLQIKLNFADSGKPAQYRPLDIFGSRGQKRLGVLWLKMAELAFVRRQTRLNPVLLLDDILSELDETSRNLVLDLVDRQQTIITSVEKELVSELKAQFAKVQIEKLPL
jgi:DNA replication and repair protein RecF